MTKRNWKKQEWGATGSISKPYQNLTVELNKTVNSQEDFEKIAKGLAKQRKQKYIYAKMSEGNKGNIYLGFNQFSYSKEELKRIMRALK